MAEVWMAPLLVGRLGVLSLFLTLVGKGKMAFGLAACAFFAEIGPIAGDMEDNVSGMILDFVIRVGHRVV